MKPERSEDPATRLLTWFASTLPDASGEGLRDKESTFGDEVRGRQQLARCTALLQQLPAEAAGKAFTALLQAMTAACQPRAPNDDDPQPVKDLRIANLIDLVRLSPWPLTDEHRGLLGGLVALRSGTPVLADALTEQFAHLASESVAMRDRVIRLLVHARPTSLSRILPPLRDVDRADDLVLLLGQQAAIGSDEESQRPIEAEIAVNRRVLELLQAGSSVGAVADRAELLREQMAISLDLCTASGVAARESVFGVLAARGLIVDFGAEALEKGQTATLGQLAIWLAQQPGAEPALVRRLAVAAGWMWCRQASAHLEHDEVLDWEHELRADPAIDALCGDAELRGQLASVRLALLMAGHDDAAALAGILSPSLAAPVRAHLVAEFLASWGGRRDLAAQLAKLDQGTPPDATALRLADAQACAISELVAASTRMRELPEAPELGQHLLAALLRCHSPTEVYRLEDFERVLGPVDGWSASQLVAFLDGATAFFVNHWIRYRLQELAQTGRTVAEHAREVERGVHLIEAMAGRYAAAVPAEAWRSLIWQGWAAGAWARFAQASKTENQEFAARRAAAATFARRALEEYCALRRQGLALRSIAAVQNAFVVATRGAGDKVDAVDAIGHAVATLGPTEAAWHWESLARALQDFLTKCDAADRFPVARAVARLLGERDDIAYARQIVDRGDAFLAGVRVHAEIDGAGDVGQGPFGVRFAFRYREAAMRATGGFGRYLVDEGTDHNPPIQYRTDMESTIRNFLQSAFVVEALALAPPSVLPRRVPAEGEDWFETPIGYAILRARDRAAAAIPAIPLAVDVDRDDAERMLSLSVASAPLPVRASGEAAPRPAADVHVVQTLDEKELGSGRLLVTVKANAVGVLPPIERLLRLPAGSPYRIDRVTEERLSLQGLDDSSRPQIEVTADLLIDTSAAGPDDEFVFPAVAVPLAAPAKLEWRRYPMTAYDTGIEAIGPRIALRGWPRAFPTALLWGGAALLLALCGSLWLRRRTVQPAPAPTVAIDLPAVADGPNVSLFLRRLHAEFAAALTPEDRSALSDELHRIEQATFGRDDGADIDFAAVARRWAERARGARVG